MIYVICGLAGFLLAVFFYNFDDIKRNRKNKKIAKRYKRLRNGVPKRVVHLTDWDDLWRYRQYPISINGNTLAVSRYEWWHCNDDTWKTLLDLDGQSIGYITSRTDKRCYDSQGKMFFIRSLGLSQVPSAYGKRIMACAVIEVY